MQTVLAFGARAFQPSKPIASNGRVAGRLDLVEQPGDVAQALHVVGLAHESWYLYKAVVAEGGVDGMLE